MPVNEPHAMVPPTGTQNTPMLPSPAAPDVTKARYGQCDAQFTVQDYDLPVLTLSGVLLIAGIVYCFLGYRLFKAVMFATGVLFASVVVYIVCTSEKVLPHQLGNAAVALGAGVLFGLITMLVEYVGLFLTGFLTGLHFGVVALVVANYTSHLHSIWVTIGVLFLCGLTLALMTLRWSRSMLIIGTSVMGSAMVMISLDYITQRFADLYWLYDVMHMKHPPIEAVCWYGWLLMAMWPVGMMTGLVVQFRITGDRRTLRKASSPSSRASDSSPQSNLREVRTSSSSDHRERNNHHHQQQSQPPRHKRTAHAILKAPAHAAKQAVITTSSPTDGSPIQSPYRKKSFRSLYKARQKHGDVICQSFMDSIDRQRQSSNTSALNNNGHNPNRNSNEITTLSSENTRITVLSEGNTPPIGDPAR